MTGESSLPPHAVQRLLALGAGGDAPAPGPPADIDRYRILRELGRGGMGCVYEAEDTLLERTVALKVLPAAAGLSPTLRRRFVREARAAARLTHANIAAVYDATPDYIAMQRIRGGDILSVCGAGADPRRTAGLLRDAARAVHYAHERGIVHRDLKPSNLMVESEDDRHTVFVLDFGLAKEIAAESSLSASGGVLGTPGYMSPEQARGRGEQVDGRADVYGLGATLYACLAGRPPFAGDDLIRVLRDVVEREPPRLDVEPDLWAITAKCLAKNPQERYSTAAALAFDLDCWLHGKPVAARPPSAFDRLRKLVVRRRAIVLPVAAAVLVSAGLGVVALQQRAARAAAQQAVRLATQTATVFDNVELHVRDNRTDAAYSLLAAAITDWRAFLGEHEIAEGYYWLGRLLRAHERREEAHAALDRALQLEPGHVGARFERGLLNMAELGSLWAQARLATLDLPPNHAQAQRAWTQAVLEDFAVVDTPAASAHLRRVDVLYARAQRHRLAGEWQRAEQGLLAVVDLDPEYGAARLALARLYHERGMPDKAFAHAAGHVDLRRGFAPVFLARSALATVKPVPAQAPAWGVVLPLVLDRDRVPLADAAAAHRAAPRQALRSAVHAVDAARQALAAAATGDEVAADAAWQRVVAECDAALSVEPDLPHATHNRAVARAALHDRARAAGATLRAVELERAALAGFLDVQKRAPRFGAAWLGEAVLRVARARRLLRLGRVSSAREEVERAARCHARAEDAPSDLVAALADALATLRAAIAADRG